MVSLHGTKRVEKGLFGKKTSLFLKSSAEDYLKRASKEIDLFLCRPTRSTQLWNDAKCNVVLLNSDFPPYSSRPKGSRSIMSSSIKSPIEETVDTFEDILQQQRQQCRRLYCCHTRTKLKKTQKDKGCLKNKAG